jgi:hypothetical protein
VVEAIKNIVGGGGGAVWMSRVHLFLFLVLCLFYDEAEWYVHFSTPISIIESYPFISISSRFHSSFHSHAHAMIQSIILNKLTSTAT